MRTKITMALFILSFIAGILIIRCTECDSYLNQTPPIDKPEIFAPGIVSTGHDELFGSFTPNGKEFYYIQAGVPYWTINVIKQYKNKWLKPEVAQFSDQYTSKFCISPDGNTIVLTSFCNDTRTTKSNVTTCWNVIRQKVGWSKPIYIDGIDSAFAPSIARNKNLYFFKMGEEHQDLYVSMYKNGSYQKPLNLGDSINSLQNEADPFIDPDERYILWNSNRTEGEGIYISYKREDGLWTKAKNIGENINSLAPVNVGSVTPDGKYMFLFSNKYHFDYFKNREINYKEKLDILNSPGNGSIDIYWVSAKCIENLKPNHLK